MSALQPDNDDRLTLLIRWLTTIKDAPGHVIESTAAAGFKGSTLPLDDVPAAAAKLLADSEVSDTYLRTTTTRTPITSGRGTKADTYAVFGFFADLDHAQGVHKPPSDGPPLPPDNDTCLQIIESLLVPTLIVDTSGGLQAWWLFTQAVTVDDRPDALDLMKRWGEMLVSLGNRAGWHVDKVGDASRVLRPPGTLNHKWKSRGEPPRPVAIHSSTGARYDLDQLAAYLPDDVVVDINPRLSGGGGDHADISRWEADNDWSDILKPHSWTLSRTFSGGCREWTRPGEGQSSARSAVTDFNGVPTMVVHSSATGLPSGGGEKLTKFKVWAHLNHNGDRRAASDAIRASHGASMLPSLVNPPGQTQPDTPESDADVRMVQPPSNPYPNAAQYVSDRHTNDSHTLLAHHGGDWHHWTGTCWPPLSDTALDNNLYDYFNDAVYETDKGIKPFQPSRSKVADLVHAMRAVCPVDETVVAPAWLDGRTTPPASEIIACRNGLLHWPTRTLTPHDPTFWTHHSVPFDYDPRAPTPTAWCAFLNDLWGDDGQSIDCLQEMFGYLLSGDTSLQKLFAVVGPKRSGKGTIARVLTALIGHANVTGPSLSAFAQQFGLQPLVGKPVAIIADARLRQGDDLVNTRLLSISGEDMLTVDRKYRDHWHGTLPTRIVILSNDLPNLPDPSGSLASRFVLLMTLKSFYGREDQGLTNRLLVELPGILNWSLDGLERLRHRGRFVVPESSSEAMREMEDLGSPISAFIRDRCEVEPGVSISVDQLYKAWVAWCGENGRDHPGTQQRFGRDLRSAVPGLRVRHPRTTGGRVRMYEGIRLSFSMEVPL